MVLAASSFLCFSENHSVVEFFGADFMGSQPQQTLWNFPKQIPTPKIMKNEFLV